MGKVSEFIIINETIAVDVCRLEGSSTTLLLNCSTVITRFPSLHTLRSMNAIIYINVFFHSDTAIQPLATVFVLCLARDHLPSLASVFILSLLFSYVVDMYPCLSLITTKVYGVFYLLI